MHQIETWLAAAMEHILELCFLVEDASRDVGVRQIWQEWGGASYNVPHLGWNSFNVYNRVKSQITAVKASPPILKNKLGSRSFENSHTEVHALRGKDLEVE